MWRLGIGRPRLRSGRVVCLMLASTLVSCWQRGDAPQAKAPAEARTASASPVAARREATPAEICVRVMQRTRKCEAMYVPGLLALRVRLDQPSGIAKRFEAQGRERLLALARAQFERDWSDEAIARNCTALAQKSADEQERIIAPERQCLQADRCSTFTTCDLAHKEQRWTAAPASRAPSLSQR